MKASTTVRSLITLFFLITLSAWQSAHAQCCGAEPTTFTQPDGSVIEVHFHGNERYTRTVSADGYTLIFDHAARAYHYADLDVTGDAFVSTGVLAKPAKPADLTLRRDLQLNPEARRILAEKRGAELELVRKDKEKWNQQKQLMDDYMAWKKNAAAAASTTTDGGTETGTTGPELAPPVNPPTLGNVLGLTILVDFSDVPARSDVTRADFDDYCNKPGGRTGWGNKGSIYDYFYVQSNGRLRYRNNVTYYVRVPNTFAYYNDTSVAQNSGTNGRKLLTDALNVLIANGYDFSGLTANAQGRVIATNLLWAGNSSGVWASGLWPHRWSLASPLSVGGGLYIFDYQCTNIGVSGNPTMGTFCHENGHLVGKYPDYYDTNGGSEGVGNHCLMGAGNHATQTNPTNISSYLKLHSGWLDPVDLTTFNASAPVRLAAAVDSTIVYKYTSAGALTNEYFLIENRSKVGGWESTSGLPDSGLLISHIHHTGSNSNEQRSEASHYEHSIEQADGTFDLEQGLDRGDANDYFHAGGTGPKTDFNDTTLPNAKWWAGAVAGDNTTGTNSGLQISSISAAGSVMTFVYGSGTPSGPATTRLTTSILENAADYGTNAPNQTFSVYNTGGGTVTYTISDNVSWLSVTPASGDATTETDAITVSYTTSALAAGTYNGTITVNGGTAGTQTIAVTLTIRNQPTLSATPASVTVPGIAGMTGFTGEFNLKNTGGGTAAYTVTKTQAWLTLVPTSGTVSSERDTIGLACNATGLAAGTYSDTITVTATGATNSPLTIPVSFVVDPSDMILTAPNGGENWLLDSTQNITWASSLGGNVKIELLKGGVLNSTIAASTPNDGSYSWTVPGGQTTGTDYKIRITSVESPTKADTSLNNFTIAQDMLALALDTSGLTWSTSASLPWFHQTTTTKDGVDAAQCANITHGEVTSMETTIVGPGTMTFWWQVSSESGYDFLRFYLNGVEQTGSLAKISGTVNWIQKTVTIPAGSNVVKWAYDKDGSVDGGTDTAWVDQVVYTPDAQPEIAVEQPVGTGLTDGASTINFGSVNTGSNTQLTFTIKNVGTADLTGILPTITGANSGDYTFVTPPATAASLTPGSSTTCVVKFAPLGTGTRTAALQIASDDANENPFDINLTGTGVGPGTLVVTGASGLTSSGIYSGPFTPSSIDYTLSNPGSTSINWTAAKTQGWVTLSATGGTLAAGASTTVTVSINTGANTLAVGSYSDTVSFTSSTTGNTTRPVALAVNPIVTTVTLSNLQQNYTGTPRPVTVTTNPTPVAYSVTYDGSTTAPTNGGTYAVVATVTEPNHTGSASGSLVIAYNVTYVGNGNTGGSVPADQTKFHNVDLTLAGNSGNLNKTDFSFAGWNTAADGSGTPYPAGGTYSGNAPLTLYAQWVPGSDGTWIQTAAGPFNWGDSANWNGGNIAAGADRTANFTPNITAAQVVNLDSARTIGNITFTDSTTASHDLTISGANTLTLARTSGVPTINVTNRTLTISSVIEGSNGILKTGAGTLTLNAASANTFTGGLEINGGTIATSSDGNFGGTGGITVSGSSTWSAGPSVTTYNRSLAINAGTLTLTSGNAGKTITGILSGSGGLINSSTTGFDFNNTGNTFTGSVNNGYQMSFASLGDSSNPINLIGSNSTFIWTGGAKTFALRPFTLNATGTGKCNNNGTGALTIQQNLAISGTAGARTLSLGGTYTGGANRFSGNIADGAGSVVGLTVTGNSIWALSGTNTYSGATTIGNGSSPNSTLVIQGLQALSDNTTITMTQTSTPASTLKLLDDGTGVLAKPNTLITAFNNSVMNGFIFVGNNSVANGGTSGGTTTGSTIALGTLRLGNATANQGFKEIQGANGYKLQFNNVELSAGGALTTYSPVFNPTSAAVILAGTIQQLAGNTATTTAVTLNLAGTSSGNAVTGTIKDAVDFGTNVNARSLNVTKSGTSIWTLSGNNTYTGATAVNAGSLFIHGDQSLATGDISVASGATLGGTGTIGGNATIATGGKLEFNISTAAASHNPLDLVAGKGLAFSGSSTLTITSLSGASPGIYTLITGGNNITGVAPATLVLPSGWVASVSISGNSLLLNVTSTGSVTAGSLAVTAAGGLSASGFVGGPFSPNSVVYTLSNPGQTSIDWTASKTTAWVTVSPSSGTLAAGANTTVTVSINASANSLGAGSFSDTVSFANTTNGTGNTTRSVSLTVNPLPTYTVTYDGNGNTGGSVPISQVKTQDVGLTLSGPGSLVRTGHTFTGWNTAADGSGTAYAAGATYNDNAPATLYAQWAPATYTVTFDANGGNAPSPATTLVTYGSTYGPLATATRSGYTLNGWFTAPSGGVRVTETTSVAITSNQILYAQWTVNAYTITFNSAGGSAVSPITQNFGTAVTAPAPPTRTGYTFASWSPAVPATMPANDLTVTAQWTANTYTVTFNSNGGDTPVPASKSVTYDSTYGTLATASRTGHTLAGWFTAPSGGLEVTSATPVAITAAQTLYARWTVNNYTVSYDPNGADSGTAPASQTKTHDVDLTLALNSGGLSRIGYTFSGWNTAINGSGTTYSEGATFATNADVTLYAKWTANTYTVTFDSNGGGTAVPASKSVAYGSPYGTMATSTRTGHSLNGWFTSPTGGSMVTDATMVSNASNHTLYAQWTQVASEMNVYRSATEIADGGYDGINGSIALADSKLSYEITNIGNDNLTLGNAVISGNNNCSVTIDSQPSSSVVPSVSTNLILTAVPAAPGAWSFTVSIASNDSDENPYNWTVHGVAQGSATMTLVASADTFINKDAPTTPNGGATTINLNAHQNQTRQGLINFDVATVPGGATITAASLDFVAAGGQSGSVQVLNTNAAWNASTATWNLDSGAIGATSYGSATIATASLGTAVPNIGLDANGVALVQGWVNNTIARNGFSIKTSYSNSKANNSVSVCSADHGTAAYRPKLNLTYTLNPQVAEMHVTRAGAVVADGATDVVSGTVMGSAAPVTYSIANLGNVDLTVTNPVSVTGASNCAVVISTPPAGIVAASTSTSLVVAVTPAFAGLWSANISIVNNDPDENPYNWTISGTASGVYTVTLDAQGGSGGTASVLASVGAPMPSANAPSRVGHTFGGYYTQSGGLGTQYYTSLMASSRNWDIAAATTLHAKWTINSYSLTYAAGAGGSVTGSVSQTVNHGSNGSQVTAVPNTGYYFVKWSDNVMTAARTDSNVTANIAVSAIFDVIHFNNWVAGTFVNGALGNQSMSFDFDGDGLPTGVEWVVGGDPTLGTDAASKKPVFDNTSDNTYAIYTYRRTDLALADTTTSIAVEYGSSLTGWTTAVHDGNNIIIAVTNDGYGAGVDKVDVKIKRTLAPSGKLFARLKVAVTP